MAPRKKTPIATEPPLTLGAYQEQAAKTDHTGNDPEDGMLVSVLGIVGESGDLATLFKKRLRDGDSFTLYPEQLAEEIGDILWYVANVSTKLSLSLEDVARENLRKTKARWEKFEPQTERRPFLDAAYPSDEQIPRLFNVDFTESGGRTKKLTLYRDGIQCGDALTDNSYFEDGYRYHDVFHLAYAAVLGWSPVTRKILGCKRRSRKQVDEIEDGGRAAVLEEGIAALAFEYAEKHNMLDGIGRVDSDLLNLIARLTAGLEIREASAGEWEQAILTGFKVFRLLNRHKGGRVTVDLGNKSLRYETPRARAGR